VALGFLVLLAGVGLVPVGVASGHAEDPLLKGTKDVFELLPKDMATREFPVTPERVALGRKLFFDPCISADGTVSCMRCHQVALAATDGLAQSRGVHNFATARGAGPSTRDRHEYESTRFGMSGRSGRQV